MRAYLITEEGSASAVWRGTLGTAEKLAKSRAAYSAQVPHYIDECDVADNKDALIDLLNGQEPRYTVIRSWLVEKGKRGFHLTEIYKRT